ncbi:MAG TPA: hypothetical protein VFO79_10895 [Xanthomonadales bacterium]|nr:hypothetical protein [Xanthomonadales bacterium]
MNQALGLMFQQGYLATPAALAAASPDLVTRVADAIEAATSRRTPAAAAPERAADGLCLAC